MEGTDGQIMNNTAIVDQGGRGEDVIEPAII